MLSIKSEIARKALHIFGAVMFIWLGLLEYKKCIWVIALCFVILDFARRNDTVYGMRVRGLIRQLGLDRLMRSEEEKSFTGATYMAISAAVCVVLFPLWIYVMGFLILAFADPVATFIGKTVGKSPIGYGKTLEGSAAFFTTSVLIMVLLSGIIGFDEIFLMLTVAAVAAATFAELFSGKWCVNDNLAVPLAFGLVLDCLTGFYLWF
ncbi:MAG: hypothetical protein JSS50_03960 [Proteobacteria bacterium]|nr:hypothetical protein [Pseudomonadota bacterium]